MRENMDSTLINESASGVGKATPDADPEIVVYKQFYERQILAAIFIMGTIFGVIGNCLVIGAVALSKKLQTSTNVFVVNLAVADVLTCLAAPWQAAAVLGADGWPIPAGQWLCVTTAFITVLAIGCSVNNLALIAVNRWVGITKSRYTTRRIYTARKLGLMVVLAWTIPLGCAMTPVLTDFGQLGYEQLYRTCSWVKTNPNTGGYNMLIAAAFYPVQLFFIILSYVSIFIYVRRTSGNMTKVEESTKMKRKVWRRQIAVTKNLAYIVLVFLLSLTPYFICLIVYADWTYRLVPWAGAILFCNSCVNPVIYSTSHPDFKRAFRHARQFTRNKTMGSSRENTVSSSDV